MHVVKYFEYRQTKHKMIPVWLRQFILFFKVHEYVVKNVKKKSSTISEQCYR